MCTYTFKTYVGHIISAGGLKPDPAKVGAILRMPPSTDKQGLRRLMEMVNYLQKFTSGLSEVTKLMRDLLKENVKFVCDKGVHGERFKRLKAVIASAPVLNFLYPSVEAVLQCDASQHGLGACLMQNGQPLAYASRSLTPTESKYVQIEKELLAIVFGVEKFESYVNGKRFKVGTDQPLESILKKSLLSAPRHLQRMLLRLQNFDFEVEYKKGMLLHVADTLSRAYVPRTQAKGAESHVLFAADARSLLEQTVESINSLSYVSITLQGLARVQQPTEAGSGMAVLKTMIKARWSDTQEKVPDCIQEYFSCRDELFVQDGLVFKGERLVTPPNIREELRQK